jgi:hypothetical protein
MTDEWHETTAGLLLALKEACRERDEARAECERLRRDARRLDWMDANGAFNWLPCETVRDAIDIYLDDDDAPPKPAPGEEE